MSTKKDDEREVEIKSNHNTLEWANYVFMISLAIVVKTWQPLAIASVKNPDDSYPFNKTVMVIVVELIKMVFCGIVLSIQLLQTHPAKRDALVNLPFSQSLHFLVPSVLYAVSNTVVYVSFGYIHPALFHIFGNFRVLIAGIMYRFIMGRKHTDIQWVSLVLLTAGAILSSPEISDPDVIDKSETIYGLFLIVIMCICSTCSSIYTEKNYKKTEELSIFFQNIVLYTYGIAVNLIYLLMFSNDPSIASKGYFYGFDSNIIEVLFVQSLMGVSLSFIFKFLDSIVYVISLTVSMLLTAIISIMFYGFQFSISFGCSLLIVVLSIYLYYRERIHERFKLSKDRLLF